jgi:Gas vesicle synthesis protein GvpL/GvpF
MGNDKGNRWVYGVVPEAASLEELERRADSLPPVWLLAMGELAAIVGDAPENDAHGVRNQALAHARVLEAAVADAPVIPVRFGTVIAGGDEAVGTELLDANYDEFARLVQRFHGLLQMTLKVEYNEDAILREIVESEPAIAQLRKHSRRGSQVATHGARARLGELVYNALGRRAQIDADYILKRLRPFSVGATVAEPESEFMLLNAPFLIERTRTREFEALAGTIADERRKLMQFMLLGPMPAYDFLDVHARVGA